MPVGAWHYATMKYPVTEVMRKFLSGEMSVGEYRDTLETWNRTGLWDELSAPEKKLLAAYFRFYLDMYGGETLPRFSWWERCKRDMKGESNVDLATLREGTTKFLEAWTKTRTPRTVIDEIVGLQVVHVTKLPNVVLLSGTFLKRFNDQKKVALISHLGRLYSKTFLHLDPLDEDVFKETTRHWELMSTHLYLIPNEQDLSLLCQGLHRGNWLLLFRNQVIGADFRIPEGYGNPDVMQQLLRESDEQFVIASGPDDTEWTVGWS